MRPYLKKIHHKKGLVEWLQGLGPEFKSQYWNKEKEMKEKQVNMTQKWEKSIKTNLKMTQMKKISGQKH
jgi:hypothetical protein